jgi:hypothetical protein
MKNLKWINKDFYFKAFQIKLNDVNKKSENWIEFNTWEECKKIFFDNIVMTEIESDLKII